MKRILILMSFCIGSLTAMAPDENHSSDRSAQKRPQSLEKFSPFKAALLEIQRVRECEADAEHAAHEDDRAALRRSREEARSLLVSIQKRVDQVCVGAISDPDRATRCNKIGSYFFCRALKHVRGVCGINPRDPASLEQLHCRLHAILGDEGNVEDRRLLLRSMRLHVPYGETPAYFAPWALAIDHIVAEKNSSRGWHVLRNAAQWEHFREKTLENGVAIEENGETHVLHGKPARLGKTIFPPGTTANDVIQSVLSILNDRNLVVMRRKLDQLPGSNRWSYLGISRDVLRGCPLEIVVDEDKRVVETAYPIFSLVECETKSEKPIVVLNRSGQPPLLMSAEQLHEIAVDLIRSYRDNAEKRHCTKIEAKMYGFVPTMPKDVENGDSSSAASAAPRGEDTDDVESDSSDDKAAPKIENPVKYRGSGFKVVDIAPALKKTGVTAVDHGIYVVFEEDYLDKPLERDVKRVRRAMQWQ